MSDDLTLRPATELAALVRTRALSPVELVEHCLARIEQLDPALHSIVTVDAERALAAAKAMAEQAGAEDAPPLLGVPVAVKDNTRTEGLRTTFATASLAEFVPTFDDEQVARLRRAGLIVLAKTNTPELGTRPYTESALLGPCRNPWHLERNAGGSSGGSAAAVAAGLVPLAHGSDGGGSVRIPAACCGVVGLKPARGRVSNAPLTGDAPGGLVTAGTLARTVSDAAVLLDALRGYAVGDPHWAPEPARAFAAEAATAPPRLRIGLVTETPRAEFGAEPLAAAEQAAALLEDLGHTVEPLRLPATKDLARNFAVLWCAKVASAPLAHETLEPFNQALARWGTETTAGELLEALSALQAEARAIVGACLQVDVVLSPTLTRTPLRNGELAELDPAEAFAAGGRLIGNSSVANVTGQPAISVPIGFAQEDGADLPVGVTLLGRPADEATLLQLAAELEQAAGWEAQWPPAAAPS